MIVWERVPGWGHWKICQTAEVKPHAGPEPWQVTELCQSEQGLINMDKPAGTEGEHEGGRKARREVSSPQAQQDGL